MTAPIDRPVGHDEILSLLDGLADEAAAKPDAAIPHAFVFAGPPGVGKFHTALWWAARLKCREGSPCGQCSDCRQVAALSHPDLLVIERIEGNKDIRIKQIRPPLPSQRHEEPPPRPPLLSVMSLRAVRPGPRVGIIRDAELMNSVAQSALLKLLEEPPGFAVLILVANNSGALKATIRSRCQILRFRPLDDESITRILARRGIDSKDAVVAANLARGSAERAIALAGEALEARQDLIAAFERYAGGKQPLAELVERIAGADPSASDALLTLWRWQMEKVEAALGYRPNKESDTLERLLRKAEGEDYRRLIHGAERVHWALAALRRNANARLVIRDMLLDFRKP
ncbi:MAG: hypothetical protein D6760_11270 [Deltaproteobacteria bacterium]|nr:MAG: hypothetical protein D6760_11270 [Deltaproteobacteria bacterium]